MEYHNIVIDDQDNGFPILECELPEGYGYIGNVSVVSFEHGKQLKFDGQVRNHDQSLIMGFQSGEMYACTKVGRSHNSGRDEDNNICVQRMFSVEEQADAFISSLLGTRSSALHRLELPQRLKQTQYAMHNDFMDRIQQSYQLATAINQQRLMPVSLGLEISGYLADGTISLYRHGEGLAAIAFMRNGYESALVQGRNGIYENLQNVPFGNAQVPYGAVTASALWGVPVAFWMISKEGTEEDFNVFVHMIETMRLTKELKDYDNQLFETNNQQAYQVAMSSIMQNNILWQNAFAQQQASWAASDRLRDSLSHDLDSWRQANNARTQASDMRFRTSPTMGETSDDRIQRLRHEATMGVDTYDREDGTTVEYSTQATRVFENNLDNTIHFGTEHYYDDYVPDGWHELHRKK